MKKTLLLLLLINVGLNRTFAQEDPTIELKEVVVSDMRLKRYSEGHKVTELKDSTIRRQNKSFTSLLNFNSNIYFKENGYGMVSSPAFRGTNASHTAVIWNGININSQLNGQTDFNTVDPLSYSSIGIRSGGGSVQYGSGAIGGSVHLNNDLRFDDHFEHRVLLGYGSYETKTINYTQSYGDSKWSSNFGVNFKKSDNDYTYLKTGDKNVNGEYGLLNFNFNAGYVLSGSQVLRLYHQSFIGDRNLSGTIVSEGRSKYKDNQYRTQLEWVRFGAKATSKAKLAYLQEEYRYYENKNSDSYSYGKVSTFLARYALDMALSKRFRLHSFLEFDNYEGAGDSFGNPKRNDFSATALLKHQVSPKLAYNISLRQDFSSDYSCPLVFSLDGKYALTKEYDIQLSASKNFRTPTFNDLYWEPGGNTDLLAESSYQIDLGHRLRFGGLTFNLNGYYIATEDMIKWLPGSDGIWSPINIDDVQIYGVEAELGLDYGISENQKIGFKSNYAYTVSEDKSTNEQLIYVPFHRANASLTYSLLNFNVFYQHLYNGPVSIIGGELDGYDVANIGITYTGTLEKIQYTLGVNINNLYDTYYENIALRPMPNRNIQSQLIINF
ncbi:TonB-dependent receptor plug domain-containing protein [Maribacter polysaccharolyticus]|uniref:TonB-dependent receptor plug domain-containing protein n=1 Tax=Maribacter polysaccharolyticus TaxID=3020831 RepID=UPI00237F24C3|nr:TonB-dependent receptor [Maribacter polysaccharolyticus]MDE3740730.1 TonB-dependent receptor [Maribacter polysaccharolyticus]